MLARSLARERQQIAHDPPSPLRLFLNDLQVATILLAELLLLQQKLRESGDRGERIVQLVCDARHQLADRRQLLALHELCFERLLLGNVFHEDDDALLAGGSRNAGRIHPERALQAVRAGYEGGRALSAAYRTQQIGQGV